MFQDDKGLLNSSTFLCLKSLFESYQIEMLCTRISQMLSKRFVIEMFIKNIHLLHEQIFQGRNIRYLVNISYNNWLINVILQFQKYYGEA